MDLLRDSLLNKGTAYSEEERDALGLRGLLPPRIFPMEQQVTRAYGNFSRKTDPLEKYIFLTLLQQRNETLFYRLLLTHLEEMMPIIYTPTVGQACLEYGSIFRRPRGLWITIKDRGRIAEILRHWPHQGARMIVVTDGQRILGLGDLGALGMGIPIGKLALYTACGGLHPYYCLPITLDVGTDNESLLRDQMYIGLGQPRVTGPEYEAFLDEFIEATQNVFPGCVVQFEDFGNHHAFELLHRWRDRICTFNDDIQGTAAVALGGLIGAARLRGRRLAEEKILFFGAGEAGTGIAELFVAALRDEGISEAEARAKCWFIDSQGLVVAGRPGKLAAHKAAFAHDHPFLPGLEEAVDVLKPTALIGVAGTGRAFTQKIVQRMAELNEAPVIFALSNPTSKAECTAEEAYYWTDGRAVFASGSPFAPVEQGGRTFHPGQGNNVYIFPGLGFGALASGSTRITDAMFLAAAHTLAECVGPEDLALGRVYPSFERIREVSLKIAVATARQAWDGGLARMPRPDDLEADLRARMFEPDYLEYA
ncbi:MAG: NAD-dependent malic enzyme [Candidatus Methylacidiphilales bacterium]|nr:NAD-dependent malic enzyme [Candidatus Methylacidiphilales bacterium]